MGTEHSLYEEVKNLIEEERMLAPGETVVAGVSGGPDSVCLLHLLVRLRAEWDLRLRAVHLEHGLRGEEGLADAAFTERLCGLWEVPCRTEHRDVAALARASGRSGEEQGRLERYSLFEQELEAAGGGKIAVAHNRDDQAETLLLNLARGSGLHGLCGMRPVRGHVIRPLLYTGRDRIESWLSEHGIPWRTDATNAGMEYARNRVRNLILPQMKEALNSRTAEHLASAARYLQQADGFLDRCAARFLEENAEKSASPGRIGVSAAVLAGADPALLPYIIRHMAARARGTEEVPDLTAVHIGLVKEACSLQSGRGTDLPGGLRVYREGSLLCFGYGTPDPDEAPDPVMIDGPGIYRFDGGTYEVEYTTGARAGDFTREKKYTKYVSCDTIQHTICLRRGRPDDRIMIDGRGHTVSLWDHLKKQKVPAGRRGETTVLADGGRILWVVGGRIGEDAKIRNDTGRVLRIRRTEPRQGEYDERNSQHHDTGE